MFANQLLKDKLTLNQQQQVEQQQQENDDHMQQGQQQQQEDSQSKEADEDMNHNDFTFDQYIPNEEMGWKGEGCGDTGSDNRVRGQQKEKGDGDDGLDNAEENFGHKGRGIQEFQQQQYQQQAESSSSQLSILKSHILTIESIAMKQIEALKHQLQIQRQEKLELQRQLTNFKQRQNHPHVSNQPVISHQPEISTTLLLLKEQNTMLKTALKKQLQINRHLMRQAMLGGSDDKILEDQQNQHVQDDDETKTKQEHKDFNKQNCPRAINSDEMKLMLLSDKPAIPLPGHRRRDVAVGVVRG